MMVGKTNSIRTFALVCVGLSSIFIMSMVIWFTHIIASPEWCYQALGADKLAGGRSETAVSGCLKLFERQLDALAWNSHIFSAIIALSLLVLMVIVVAGGKLSFKASKDGLEGSINEEPRQDEIEASSNLDEIVEEVVEENGLDR